MSAALPLADYLARSPLRRRLVLVANLQAAATAVAPELPHIVIIATGDTLALLPLRGARLPELQAVRAFSSDFATFPRFQRRWRWTAVLQIQLDVLLGELLAALDSGVGAGMYLYLNGAFSRKYFPSSQPATTAHAAALPAPDNESCRAGNARLEDILAAFGNASLHGTSLHATPGHDSYHCYSQQHRMLGIGRGGTERQMRCGAVFEYCERWAGLARPDNCVTGSHAGLRQQALAPEQLLGLSEEQCQRLVPGFQRDRAMEWLPARLEDDGGAALVPLAMVNYLLDPGVPFSRYQNSNGCALGNSFEEAALFGALEVIERDALLTMWYSRSTPPRIDVVATTCQHTAGLLMLLGLAGYDVLCFDITLDLPVPSTLVLMLGRDSGRLAAFVTAASHPHAAVALRSALAEAQSLIGSAERNFARHQRRLERDPAELQRLRNDSQALYYGHAAQRHCFDFLGGATPSLDYADFIARHLIEPCAAPAAYRRLCGQAADAGYRLVSVDNTPAMLQPLGLASARVFIPGTIPLAFGDHCAAVPAQRLQRAARRAPWVRLDADLSAPLIHPLG
ncbi:YcaO-like family protein [Janthinobacterium agaricidamnosum]|uniref:YcaO-like family protein n=1 Tax=Janthinobacterium agaricidamnosum NBRC 102515 = DSM 9628 TaxID=1349767 RepID=W0VE14_9BURK|nr:YcaO-like family protein [Janthinobacterium agaricidamnosum]CDG85915.1 ycaO-like family protein [Janthinobacterium agaricidamnosum NBRC 102515 = DSM 9628]